MAKKDYNWIWILIAIIVIIYGGQQGWFKSIVNFPFQNQTYSIINNLDNPPAPQPGDTCTLTIGPSPITAEASVTGTLNYKGLTDCEVWAKFNNQWQKVWEGKTNIDGSVTKSETIETVGDWLFAGKCGTCYTNQVLIKVTEKPPIDYTRQCNSDIDCIIFGRNYRCIDWECKLVLEGAYTLSSCISTSQTNGFYGGAQITLDGSIWTSQDCYEAARSSCSSQGLGYDGDDEIDENCCGWNCAGYTPLQCSDLAVSGGWTNFNQDPRTTTDCATLCHNWCPYTPDALCMSYNFLQPNCCMWKCHIPR